MPQDPSITPSPWARVACDLMSVHADVQLLVHDLEHGPLSGYGIAAVDKVLAHLGSALKWLSAARDSIPDVGA